MDFDYDRDDDLELENRKIELENRKSSFVAAQEDAVKNGLHLIRNFQRDNLPLSYTNNVTYEYRILDAISRLLHIEPKLACVSVAAQGHDLLVTYNSTTKLNSAKVRDLESKINSLFKILNNPDHFDRYYNLVEFCVKNNHDFYLSEKKELPYSLKNVLELLPKRVSEEVGKFYDLLVGKYDSFEEFGSSFKKIEESYYGIVVAISELNMGFTSDSSDYDDSSSSDDTDLGPGRALEIIKNDKSRILKAMERLEQDCYKIAKYFHEYVKVSNIKFIENNDNMHSELSLLEELKGEGAYIGCSKLSCFLCDMILSQDETERNKLHLGGHGIAYPMDNNDLPEMLFTGRYQKAINKILSEASCCYNVDCSAKSEPEGSHQYAPVSPFTEILGDAFEVLP